MILFNTVVLRMEKKKKNTRKYNDYMIVYITFI